MADNRDVRTLVKGLHILERFVFDKPEWGARELAAHLGISKSVLHKFLMTLERYGWLEKSSSGKYRLSMGFYRFAAIVAARCDLKTVARNVMESLRPKSDGNLYLCVRDGQHLVFVERVEGNDRVQYVMHLGQRYPLAVGSAGKVILAFCSDEESEGLPEKLREELRDIRLRGYAVTYGERIEGVIGIAAPIRDSTGKAIASLDLTIPRARFEENKLQEYVVMIKEAAREISLFMGYYGGDEEQRRGSA